MRRCDTGDGQNRREMGVEILLNEPVERVLVEKGRAIGVKTAHHSLPADAVVVNADFAVRCGGWSRIICARSGQMRRLAKKDYSCSTFMMYLGIDGCYDDVSHHTIYLAENYRQNLRDIETLHRLSENPSFYVQNASVTDPTLAPKGKSTLYVLLPVTHETASAGGNWWIGRGRRRGFGGSPLSSWRRSA